MFGENLGTQINSLFSNIYHLSFFRKKNQLSLQVAKFILGKITDSLKSKHFYFWVAVSWMGSWENEFTHKCVDGQSRLSELPLL